MSVLPENEWDVGLCSGCNCFSSFYLVECGFFPRHDSSEQEVRHGGTCVSHFSNSQKCIFLWGVGGFKSNLVLLKGLFLPFFFLEASQFP